ncbi:hypothetical protein Acj9p077 [Acinetobacter phage Acj9]|uniref:Uncharacterized protein n=1 Tax=Acinetobacter phage Acj9 TaxID=760939 RepID=E5EPL1_9CAUD|nr:hypothetical protein Acj9p077 [Acinetobacter phage Acj9]ADG59977.1 hypothetical protein Acj9p077 [Acinetobacter phage Acj9]
MSTSEQIILEEKMRTIQRLVEDASRYAESEGLNFTIETTSGTLKHESQWQSSWASSTY